jgi:PAS domain-containing protein
VSSVPGEQKGFRLRGIGLGAVFAALLLGAISLFGQNVQLGSLIPTFAIFVLVTLTVILAFKSSRRARDLERLIEKQARELKASEELGRLSLASASQGIYDLNVQTGDVNVSPEYAAMLGYDPDDYSLTFDSWVEQVHPDDREDTKARLRNTGWNSGSIQSRATGNGFFL